MVSQKDFESVELLGNALDIIKAVNSNHQLNALELLFKGGDALFDFLLSQPFRELVRIDTDRKSANSDNLAFKLDAIWGSRQPQDARATAQKVSCVVVCVEADQITV